MICIAAFIILAILVLTVPVVRLFSYKIADKIWSMFKLAWHCVGRRVTFRKCDNSFKDEIKNSVLKKVVLDKPQLVKPISVGIEILAVLIVLVTVWSLVVSAKSVTTLIAFGTCDVQRPSACVVGDTEACYVGEGQGADMNIFESTVNWFVEWGEAFAAIPAKFVNWQASDFMPADAGFYNPYDENKKTALEIFDPGCAWCRESYRNLKESGFLDEHNVALLPYALMSGDEFRYANSDLIVRYIEATRLVPLSNGERPAEWLIIDRLFTVNSPRQVLYQEDFNNYYNDTQVRGELNRWLTDFGYDRSEVIKITALVDGQKVRDRIDRNRDIVENQIRLVKIPTMIFDGRRIEGVFKR